MSVRIPLRLASGDASSAPAPGGLRLNLPIFAGRGAGLLSRPVDRETELVRAVAAGVALCDPVQATKLAERAKQAPESALDPKIDREALAELLNQVSLVRQDRTKAQPVNDVHRAAARAVGVDAVLVATAQVAAAGDRKRCDSGREWVAAIHPSLLSSAAIAGVKQVGLELIPDATSQPSSERLGTLEKELDQLDLRVKALEKPGLGKTP